MAENDILKIATYSLDIKWEDKKANMELISSSLENFDEDVDILVFPEMTLTGFSMNTNLAEEIENSETLRFFKGISIKKECVVIFGMMRKDDNVFKNSAICIYGDRILGIYDKIHLFSYAGEDDYFHAGDSIVSIDVDKVKIGLTICYDLRFSEIFSLLAKDAKIIINIANWPAKRKEHWEVLLKARAIENQICLIGVNRTGIDGNGLIYDNTTKVIYPSGIELNPLSNYKDNISTYSISIEDINDYRKDFPTFKDKKWGFYENLYRGLKDV